MVRIAPIPRLVVRPHHPERSLRRGLVLLVLWLASLLGAWHYGGHLAAPRMAHTEEQLAQARQAAVESTAELDELRGKLAVAERAGQVAQSASESMQGTLREREQEVAALRADLGFYQRLVGGSERRTLGVHTIALRPVPDSRSWSFVLTLTQNLKKSALTEGSAEISVEGVHDGKVVTVPWRELTAPSGGELHFSFKYFQRLEGMLSLPAGLSPNRILVSASSSGGERTQQAFAWADALTAGENDHAGL